jgi:hypothetical protein
LWPDSGQLPLCSIRASAMRACQSLPLGGRRRALSSRGQPTNCRPALAAGALVPQGLIMEHAALIVELVSFGFFGWLIHKYLQNKLSAVAAWFVVSLVGILQMCLAATFDVLGSLIIVGLILMFFSFLMILVVGASESRERWAKEDRLLKKVHDALKPFE